MEGWQIPYQSIILLGELIKLFKVM